METLIVTFLNALARAYELGREAFAAKLEDIAAGIRAGELIPDAAFERAKATHADTKSARDSLPD